MPPPPPPLMEPTMSRFPLRCSLLGTAAALRRALAVAPSSYPASMPPSNIGAQADDGRYCGTSSSHAAILCSKQCPTGADSECESLGKGYQCFDVTGCSLSSAGLDGIDGSSSNPFFPLVTEVDSSLLSSLTEAREYEVLVQLYDTTQGELWTRNDLWTLKDQPVCEWYGVTCDTSLGYKTISLELGSNSLRGTFDADILSLPNLTNLDLSDNYLSGSIPEEIGSPAMLEGLNLSNNQLRGAIPSSLSDLSTLELLDLRDNSFSSFRVSNGGYPSLRTLQLDRNFITGTINHNIASMKSLETISMRGNRLSGYIPADLSSLTNLTRLDVRFNFLTGTFPNLAGLDALSVDIAGNMMTWIELGACSNAKWNEGDVGMYGCDGIACPFGTALAQGRQMSSTPCEPCPTAMYIGVTDCIPDSPSPSPNPNLDVECALKCLNGGVCTKEFNREWCTCRPWYTGLLCETWLCPPGYTGSLSTGCIQNIPSPSPTNECTLECLNGGVCTPGGFNSRREWCTCPPGYTGLLCEAVSTIFYRPTPPPSFPPVATSYYSTGCTFYATSDTGRLSSFESFCGGGAGYADLGPLVDIAVLDPGTFRAIGLRTCCEMFIFDLRNGTILSSDLMPSLPGVELRSHFDVIEMANGKLYGIGWLDYRDDSGVESIIMYEMDPATLLIESRGPIFDTPIVGLAWARGRTMYAVSSCDDNSNLYEIDLDGKQATLICGDMPACFESLTYVPDGGELYGGTSTGCIARIIPDRCAVFGCDTEGGWSSHFDNVTGLAAICQDETPAPTTPRANRPTRRPSISTRPPTRRPAIMPSSYDPVTYDPRYEYEHLTKFYTETSGPKWLNNSNWEFDQGGLDACTWHGIQCDSSGRVEGIHLGANGLSGDIARAYKYLNYIPGLRALNLSNNVDLTGSLSSLNGLADLEVVDLHSCSLWGTIPRDFLSSAASNLRYLDLSENILTGHLHGWTSQSPRSWPLLAELKLAGNMLSSSIPVEIGLSMKSLEVLDLSDNEFTYEFQESYYRDLSKLTTLRLNGNKLVGELPSYDGAFYPRLQTLDVSSNEMTGVIPSFQNTAQLHFLNVSRNKFVGPIPEDLMKQSFANPTIHSAPFEVDVSFNALVGTVPAFDVISLIIEVVGNQLSALAPDVCLRSSWQNRGVYQYGCDAVACSTGTANAYGRQTSDLTPCISCPNATYIGTIGCEGELEKLSDIEATVLCSSLPYVAKYAFCVNGGTCRQSETPAGSPHQGCKCPESFWGVHCELDVSEESTDPTITMRPSPFPTGKPVTFKLHQLPSFIMVLNPQEPDKVQVPSNRKELEDITSAFLIGVLEESSGAGNDFYITTLKAKAIDESDLKLGLEANQTDLERKRTRQNTNDFLYLKVDGMVSVRDGLFNETRFVEWFITTSLERAFQEKADLLRRFQDSRNPALETITLLDISFSVDVCPNALRCLHGSRCIEREDGIYGCDCLAASGNYDGLQCEFAATNLCEGELSFCVNGGLCGPAGCICADPFVGTRCQILSDPEERAFAPAEASTASDSFTVGDYAIFIIMGIGLVLTVLIIVHHHRSKNKARTQAERKQKVEEPGSPSALEAGLASGKVSGKDSLPRKEDKQPASQQPSSVAVEAKKDEETNLESTRDGSKIITDVGHSDAAGEEKEEIASLPDEETNFEVSVDVNAETNAADNIEEGQNCSDGNGEGDAEKADSQQAMDERGR